MSGSRPQPSLPTPLLLSDLPVRMAKADSRKADMYAALGGAMGDVMRAMGLSLKEFASEIGKDERQLARQMDGTDRPQLEAIFAVERFRGPLVIALARLATGVEVDTVITVRKSA